MQVDQRAVDASMQLVIETFRSFRGELLASYGAVSYSLKEDRSQVTLLDIKVETAVRAQLAEHFPEFAFAGEETGNTLDGTIPYWVVDPIDGTSSFVRGLPNCTNMAAFVVDNQPVAAIIYDFVQDVLYTAQKDRGAFRDGERLTIRERTLDQSAMYLASHAGMSEYRDALQQSGMSVFRPFGASGRAYSLIAEGKLDAYSLIGGYGKSVHDNAPGALLVTEAGGELVTESGRPWDVQTGDFVAGTRTVTTFLQAQFTRR